MSLVKLSEFIKHHLTARDRLASPKHNVPLSVHLPTNSVLHFIAESEQAAGVDNSYSLLRNAGNPIYIYHLYKLIHQIGTPSSTGVNLNNVIRFYHKTHLAMRNISNLDRTLTSNPNPVIINYSLLPRLYKYTTNNLIVYQEWFNVRATLWDMVEQIGVRREQFIHYKLPEHMPTRNELATYAKDFKSSGLGEFHDTNALNLLELWRILSHDVDSPDSKLSAETLDHVFLTFEESGFLTFVKLNDLLYLVQEDPQEGLAKIYHFLDTLFALRTPINSRDVVDASAEDIDPSGFKVDDAIHQRIQEQASVGNLSLAEQKGLYKLAAKHRTVLDPHGSGLTLDQMVVTNDDLTVEATQVLNDSHTIHDKSLLHSTLHNYDRHYIKNVLHKDIIQTTLMLHNAGVIVKDIKVRNKTTAVTNVDTYSVHVQPINGAASVINFTIPVINEDGTFESGGVKYRLDKQKSQLPLVKVKKDSVALSSYYGKLFVTRNDSSVANYAKWLLKTILVHLNNPDNISVTDVLYGINKYTDKLPRGYTAIGESINEFTSHGLYRFIFAYGKLDSYFSKDILATVAKHQLTPCGYAIQEVLPLGMASNGVVSIVNGDHLIEIGSIPFIIDPDLGDGPIEYTEFGLLNKRIPIILALSYMFGLDQALHKLGAGFSLVSTSTRVAYNVNEYQLKFKDIRYVINISDPYVRLLVGGFSAIKNDIARFKGSDFNKQSTYSTLLSGLGITNYHLREIKLMWDMFIEPITKGLLTEMGQPTNFYDLLLVASEMLIDDHIPDLNSTRYKGYERLCGMMYRQLIKAVRTHRSAGSMSNVGVTMNPNEVWMDIVQDQSLAIVEESNPIHNLKEHESFTHVGAGGRSAVTMVKSTRAFDEKDLGVVSESTPDSQKVGIRAYFTANPNLTTLRGTTRLYDEKKDGPSSAISTSALISSAVTHDDAKRVKRL